MLWRVGWVIILLYVNPLEKEFKLDDIVALSNYCPNMKVSDSNDSYQSTIDEYIEKEKSRMNKFI